MLLKTTPYYDIVSKHGIIFATRLGSIFLKGSHSKFIYYYKSEPKECFPFGSWHGHSQINGGRPVAQR